MIHILLTDAALMIKFKLTYEQKIKDNITAVPFRNHPDQIDLDSHY